MNVESYIHKCGKMILAKWLEFDYKVKVEQEFYDNGYLTFIPDIAVYDNNGLNAIYEVVHKNGLTGKKMNRIQQYKYYNGMDFKVYEIRAYWILSQVKKPKKLKVIQFI